MSAAAAETWKNATLLFYNDSHILVGLSIKKSKTRETQDGKGEFFGLKVPVPEVVEDAELGLPLPKKTYKTVSEVKLVMTGIGGSKEDLDPSPLYTAVREFLEEIFGFDTHFAGMNTPVLEKVIPTFKTLESRFTDIVVSRLTSEPPTEVISGRSSRIFCYNFSVLTMILSLCKENGLVSRLYDTVPTTIDELLFNRKSGIRKRGAERTEIITLSLLPTVVFKSERNPLTKVLYPELSDYFKGDMVKLFQTELPDPSHVIYNSKEYSSLRKRQRRNTRKYRR